jgi:hypothetical protein
MQTITVNVEVNMADIDTDHLIRELERRDKVHTSRFTLLSEQEVMPMIDRVRLALNNKDTAKILETCKAYFYERYNIPG